MVGVVEDQALAIVQFSEKFVGAPASLVIVEATVSVNLIAIHGLIWPDTDGRRRDIPLLAVGTTVEEIRRIGIAADSFGSKGIDAVYAGWHVVTLELAERLAGASRFPLTVPFPVAHGTGLGLQPRSDEHTHKIKTI